MDRDIRRGAAIGRQWPGAIEGLRTTLRGVGNHGRVARHQNAEAIGTVERRERPADDLTETLKFVIFGPRRGVGGGSGDAVGGGIGLRTGLRGLNSGSEIVVGDRDGDMDHAGNLRIGVPGTSAPGGSPRGDGLSRWRGSRREQLGRRVGRGRDGRLGRVRRRGERAVGGGGERRGIDGDIHDHATDERQRLADPAGQGRLVGKPPGQLRGDRSAGGGILECAGEDPPRREIGDGHPLRFEPRDRRGDEDADAVGANGVELGARGRADADAGGLERFLLES